MIILNKLALSAAAIVTLASTSAFAADLAKGPWEIDGYITASSCGSLSSQLAKGAATDSSVEYPGASATGMVLATPSTTSSGSAGSAATNTCVATAAVPSTGLNGATLTFNCYNDTVSGPASSAQAQIKTTFKVGASHNANIKQVTSNSSLIIGGSTVCTFTSDGTWAHE